jgi:hypothetical protein
MKYTKKLPPVRYILSLAQDSTFPASGSELLRTAMTWGFPRSVIEFVSLFPKDEIFKSRTEFETRSEELEMLINEERSMPKELLKIL